MGVHNNNVGELARGVLIMEVNYLTPTVCSAQVRFIPGTMSAYLPV